MPTAKAVPGKTLLSSTDYPLFLVDCQAQMAFATKSIDGVVLCYNAVHWRKRADAYRAAARTSASRQKLPFSGHEVEHRPTLLSWLVREFAAGSPSARLTITRRRWTVQLPVEGGIVTQ
jgi:hypothetical protein